MTLRWIVFKVVNFVSASCLLTIVAIAVYRNKFIGIELLFALIMLGMCLLAINNLLFLYLIQKFYPTSDISGRFRFVLTFSFSLSSVLTAVLILGFFVFLDDYFRGSGPAITADNLVFGIYLLITVCNFFSVWNQPLLIRTIQNNYRRSYEDFLKDN